MQKFIIATLAIASMTEARRLRDMPQKDIHNKIQTEDFQFVAEDGQEMPAFLGWANKMGKTYKSDGEFKDRLANWKRNNKIIRDANKKARKSGKKNPVILDHNKASDNSEAELEARLGYRSMDDKRRLAEVEMKDARHLAGLTDMIIDHSEFTTPVKSQGQCGACWAFAGNTALEGTYNKYNMDPNAQNINLSEQFPVDCADETNKDPEFHLYGCNGGEAKRMWDWYAQKDANGNSINGVVLESDYPFTSGVTGTTGTCDSDKSANKQSIVTETGIAQTEYDMLQKLAERPLTAMFSVNPSTFNFYKFGLIEMGGDECMNLEYPVLNHQMTIVGYDHDGAAGEHLIPQQSIYARMKPEEGCNEDEFQWPQYPQFCLYYHTYYETAIMGDGPFWKVQNSWGDDWGHEGFVYMAIGGGLGTCDMNFVGGQWVKTTMEI